MTVYVDDARIPLGRSRWSHLTADTPEELHAFARKLGLRQSWFQGYCRSKSCRPCVHWHYDIVDTKRHAAIEAGAREVTLREMGDIIRARREAGAR